MKLRAIGSNQTEIELTNGNTIFYSYNTAVAVHVLGKGFFRTAQRYSVTTSKHVNQWLKKNGSGNATEISQDEINSLAAGK